MTRNTIVYILGTLYLFTFTLPSHADIIFRADFENEDMNEVDSKHAEEPGTVEVITNPFPNSDNSSENIIKYQNTEKSERAEIRVNGISELKEYWYGWQIYIPRLEEYVKMWELNVHMDLLKDRETDEAYLAAKPGETYVLYFTNSGSAIYTPTRSHILQLFSRNEIKVRWWDN